SKPNPITTERLPIGNPNRQASGCCTLVRPIRDVLIPAFEVDVAVDRSDLDPVLAAADGSRAGDVPAGRAAAAIPFGRFLPSEVEVADDVVLALVTTCVSDFEVELHRQIGRHRELDVATHRG